MTFFEIDEKARKKGLFVSTRSPRAQKESGKGKYGVFFVEGLQPPLFTAGSLGEIAVFVDKY